MPSSGGAGVGQAGIGVDEVHVERAAGELTMNGAATGADAQAGPVPPIGNAVLLLMGVSGSGKTTIALELRRILGWPYVVGDDLHPPANVQKMRSGQPLNDNDRLPWLQAIARWIDDRLAGGEPGIITCSNLKHAYRRITVDDRKGVLLIYLKGDHGLIGDRINQRQHQYMPASLLHSQFETLEEPSEDEHAIVVSVRGSVTETVADLLRKVASASA
jgi:carbohydrate kinase (thermoresistant glucokinase family)